MVLDTGSSSSTGSEGQRNSVAIIWFTRTPIRMRKKKYDIVFRVKKLASGGSPLKVQVRYWSDGTMYVQTKNDPGRRADGRLRSGTFHIKAGEPITKVQVKVVRDAGGRSLTAP